MFIYLAVPKSKYIKSKYIKSKYIKSKYIKSKYIKFSLLVKKIYNRPHNVKQNYILMRIMVPIKLFLYNINMLKSYKKFYCSNHILSFIKYLNAQPVTNYQHKKNILWYIYKLHKT